MGAVVGMGEGLSVAATVGASVGVGVALALAALLPTGACVWMVLLALISEMMPIVNKKPALKPKAMPMSKARQPVGSWRGDGGWGGHLVECCALIVSWTSIVKSRNVRLGDRIWQALPGMVAVSGMDGVLALARVDNNSWNRPGHYTD